jgi:hypothetical protein
MAIVVESVTTENSWSNSDTIVISKPSGTVSGDVLFAPIWVEADQTITAPSGWSFIRNDSQSDGVFKCSLYRKVAGGGEPATYTWSWASARRSSGGMLRISGANTSNPIATSNGASVVDNANPSAACTVTPTDADSLIIMVFSTKQNNNATGGYAIATDNPTWTEHIDNIENTLSYSLAVATAPRTQTSATGNASVTGLDATADSVGQLVVINPAVATATGNMFLVL